MSSCHVIYVLKPEKEHHKLHFFHMRGLDRGSAGEECRGRHSHTSRAHHLSVSGVFWVQHWMNQNPRSATFHILSLQPSGICRGELVTTFLTMKPQPKKRNVSSGTPCKRRPFFLTSTAFLKNSTVDSVAIYGPFVAGDDSVHPWCTARGGCRWNPLEAYSNIVCAFPLKHIWIILLTFVDPFRLTGFAEMPVVPSALSAGGCGKGSTARIL